MVTLIMPLDFRIAVIAIAVCCFLFAGGLFFFQTREFRRNGVLEWIVGQFLLGVYWVFMGLRGLVPDLLSIFVANVCLSASYSSLYVAVQKFKHYPYRRDFLFLPVVATLIIFLFFWAYTDNMFARSIYITFLSGIQTGFIALILFRDASLQVRRSQWFTGCMFALVAALWFIRFLELLISPGQEIIFPETNPFWTIVLTLGCGVVILLSIAALLMIRERAEEDLRRSEERYRRLFEGSVMGISEELPDGRLIQANLAYAQMYGYSSPETMLEERIRIGQQLYANSEDREEVLRILSEKGFMEPREICMTRRDGTSFFVVMTAKGMRGSDGRLLSFQTTHMDITKRKQAENRLTRLNYCFLEFGASPNDNINLLVAVCGELMNATCALYNRLGKNLLCSVGQWRTPAGFKSEDNPNGHICYDVIQHGEEHPLLVRNLQESPYAGTDPNILPYGLQTYIGMVVKLKQAAIGSLCAVYQTDITPSPEDLQFMTLIASAIAVEEDRLQMEEALHRSEENFRRSLDDSPLGIRIVTAEGETIYANRTILDIFSIEELNTTPLIKRYTPESYAEFQIRREKRKRGDYGPSEYDVSIVKKDGEVRQLQVFRKEISWDGERQFQVIYQDITEHKRAEEKLRESEVKYRNLVENVSDVIYEIDSQGVVIYISPVVRDIMGYDQADIVGKNFIEFVYEDDRSRLIERFFEFSEGIEYPFEYRLISKSGDIRWVRTKTSTIMEGGSFKGARGTLIDITDRKRAEEALRESEGKFRVAQELSPDGFTILRPIRDAQERVVDFTWVYENATIACLNGTDPKAVVGRRLLELFPGHSGSQFLRAYQLVAESGEHCVFEADYCGESMLKPTWFRIAVVPMGGDIAILAQDITERKQAEEALWNSREQMRALAGHLQAVREEERTRIAREIHDELGGALTGLKIDLSLLTKIALKIENESLKTSVLAGMDSMTQFIDSTIQSVRRIAMQLRPGVLDDLGLVAALEWQLKDFEKRTSILCKLFLPREELSLGADLSTALFRIFQEALTNVARHSGATEVCVRLGSDADSTTLEVEDNGKGIAKKKILSSKSLGLLGMRERAQMFGGRVTVTGTPGRGTTVAVEISPVENRQRDRDQEGDAG